MYLTLFFYIELLRILNFILEKEKKQVIVCVNYLKLS